MQLKTGQAGSRPLDELRYISTLKAQIADLVGELEKAEANYERARDRADKMGAELMVSKEIVTRLEGELIALKARNFWQRLFN
jgi:predicted nuclease with TOPRIM domain